MGGTSPAGSLPRRRHIAIDPPPGKGNLSGRGNWNLRGDDGRSGTIELNFAAAGSFSDDSESTILQVEEEGDRPKLYFDTNPDKQYGYTIRRETGEPPRIR
ncbi:hypothetical protein [Streptomyces incanus]